MKGVYRKVLLTTMALDDNNRWFPLVYAVIKKENNEEWSFALTGIVRALNAVENQSIYTIMFGRHKASMCSSDS